MKHLTPLEGCQGKHWCWHCTGFTRLVLAMVSLVPFALDCSDETFPVVVCVAMGNYLLIVGEVT